MFVEVTAALTQHKMPDIMDSVIALKKTSEFDNWYFSLQARAQTQIDARLERIQHSGHFGDAKALGNGLAELRWKNGWRIYFFKESLTGIVLLIGGSKNGQEKDIKKARLLLERYADFKSEKTS